jgi:hypothetical protein
MKKKIGSSKSLKKYAMAGPIESKPVIKGVASGMKSAAYDRAAEKFTQNYKPSTTKPNVPGIAQPTAKQQADMKKIETPPIMKKGGSVGKTAKTSAQKKFASLAPPKNKITFADKIAGSKKKK